jgi:hypothetical protein
VNGPTTITLDVTATFTLGVEEVWPDGDQPDVIDAAAVVAVIAKSRNVRAFLRDWNLDNDFDVDVCVDVPNPHYVASADPLFPDLVPDPIICTTGRVTFR